MRSCLMNAVSALLRLPIAAQRCGLFVSLVVMIGCGERESNDPALPAPPASVPSQSSARLDKTKLDFRIAVSPTKDAAVASVGEAILVEKGPAVRVLPGARWFPLDDPVSWAIHEENKLSIQRNPRRGFADSFDMTLAIQDGQAYILLWDLPDRSLVGSASDWYLKNVSVTHDLAALDPSNPRPNALSFELDTGGGKRLGEVTGKNIGSTLVVVLDGRANSHYRVSTKIEAHGIITKSGGFSNAELGHLLALFYTKSNSAAATQPDNPKTLVE